jgi:hypothetical protein
LCIQLQGKPFSEHVAEGRVDRYEAELALVDIMPVEPEIVVLGEKQRDAN